MRRPSFLKSAGVVMSVAALLGGGLALTATAASADTTLTATTTDDVTANVAQPNTVIGGTILRVDAATATERNTYMKFTVSGVPAGDSIASASLRLVNTDANTGNVLVNSTASSNWTESTLNWTNKPLLGPFRDAAVMAPGAGVATSFNVTGAVTGNGTVSLMVRTNNTTGAVLAFGARDNANTALRPQLIVKTKSPASIHWGSSVEQRNGETKRQALVRTETTMGTVTPRYFSGSTIAFPTNMDPLAPRSLVWSFNRNPQEILTGSDDAAFRGFLADAKNYVDANPGTDVYWGFYHEPEDDIAKGSFTAAQYRAAFTRLINISHEAAFVDPQLHSALILMKFTLEAGSGRTFDDYYPPAVDILAFDAYKFQPGTSIPSMIDPVVAIAASKGKPWAIAETGVSVKHTDAQRLTALHDLAAYIASRPVKPQFALYFNSDPCGTACPSEWNWPIDDEPTMANAWLSGQDGS